MRHGLPWFIVVGLLLSLIACGQPEAQVQHEAIEPSATPIPPTATATATATAIPTATPLPPTATPIPPTATPRPPTATLVPPTATPRPPTATTRPQPTATRAVAPTPLGAKPSGWKTYTSTSLPFTIYYPPDWGVDESKLSSGYVIFVAQKGYRGVLVGTTGQRTTASADELRDAYFNEVLAECVKKGIDITRDNNISGMVFKSVGATCNEANDPNLYYYYVGLGLNNNVPWRFRFYSLYSEYDSNVADYFFPMISSLNIFGNP
jgi:hypothetical protein